MIKLGHYIIFEDIVDAFVVIFFITIWLEAADITGSA